LPIIDDASASDALLVPFASAFDAAASESWLNRLTLPLAAAMLQLSCLPCCQQALGCFSAPAFQPAAEID
jgi:hypothetical protein